MGSLECAFVEELAGDLAGCNFVLNRPVKKDFVLVSFDIEESHRNMILEREHTVDYGQTVPTAGIGSSPFVVDR